MAGADSDSPAGTDVDADAGAGGGVADRGSAATCSAGGASLSETDAAFSAVGSAEGFSAGSFAFDFLERQNAIEGPVGKGKESAGGREGQLSLAEF